MDAREIEALSMLSRGFTELGEANPELAYQVVLDILSGINECVLEINWQFCAFAECGFIRNSAVRQHIQTSRSLFPHKRITRKSEMTARGLVVTEIQEDISGLPSGSGGLGGHSPSPSVKVDETPASPVRKSPIAELLYMRWLEGLKLKWPSMS